MTERTKSQAVINAELQASLSSLQEDVQEILKILKDNGKPGLVRKVDYMEVDLRLIKERHEKEDKNREKEEDLRRSLKANLIFFALTTILANIGLVVTIIYKMQQLMSTIK